MSPEIVEAYAERSVAGRERMVATLLGEVNALLTMSLRPPSTLADDFDGLILGLADALDRAILDPGYGFGAQATRRLLAALTLDGEHPSRGLLTDLAEILFLPRERRSEYTTNRHVAPPYRIRKLLLEYAVFGRQIDELVGVLSKDYCAHQCVSPPVGCCHILGYDLGLVPEVMLDLQRLEAHRRGWQPPGVEENCRYHTATGCVLALFKSPACVGYLCEPLVSQLRADRPGPELSRFLQQLSVFNNCDLDRRKVFRAMRATIEAGRALIAAG
jgi:hypothetical protein